MKKRISSYVALFLAILLLPLSVMMTMIPAMEVKADSPYQTYITNGTTVTINGVSGLSWYIIAADDTSVTLFPTQCIGASKFDSNGSSNVYAGSTVDNYLTNELNNGMFASVKSAVSELRLLNLSEAYYDLTNNQRICSQYSGTYYDAWWLNAPGVNENQATYVRGNDGNIYALGSVSDTLGVRPALKLDLSKVTFASNTFTVGTTTPVTSISLDKTTAQTIDIDGSVSFTATVTPDGATDKTVIWSTGNDNVKLYSDAACTTEVANELLEIAFKHQR